MPRRALRTRSKKRTKVRTPGSKVVDHYRRGPTSRPVCAACGRQILGVAKGKRSQLSKIPGSRKRVSRTYGGVLCPTCLRERVEEAAAAERL